jgi:ammonia channel protein AmtB
VTYFVIGFALGGSLSNALAQETDPAIAPGLNNFQIFIFFLACCAGIIDVLIHLAVTERMNAGAFYVVSFVAAIVSSILSWLLWGSTGPITNLGFHDFFGSAFVYVSRARWRSCSRARWASGRGSTRRIPRSRSTAPTTSASPPRA